MIETITIHKREKVAGLVSNLPASKSISNRALIIQALAGESSSLENLSEANDTVLMKKLIDSEESTLDVEDAGTTMRFLTAYFSITNQHKTLTGTSRMKERPIGILVDALRSIGSTIEYLDKDGYPPIQVKGFGQQQASEITIRGDVSSQFISALMMVAPRLPQGLRLNLTGRVGSRPYFEMTASLMRKAGAIVEIEDSTIMVFPGGYSRSNLFVESDWSGASYWFSIVALSKSSDIRLPHLFKESLQGDQAIVAIMEKLGVRAHFEGDGVRLEKGADDGPLHWDFTHCPDLAQTVAVTCAAKGIRGYFRGLESLRIKETDRINALQVELEKIGARLVENSDTWELIPSDRLPDTVWIKTYKDHRMAMAFAPLACMMNVEIENPTVVRKSYPKFWKDLEGVGFTLK